MINESSMLKSVNNIAVICTDYKKSKAYYVDILGFEIIREVYRKDRDSYKLDLSLNGQYIIELFSFPNPPKRLSQPEALGLRHLAFKVDDLDKVVSAWSGKGVNFEPIRVDEFTQKRFTFFLDPDNLPLELYEG